MFKELILRCQIAGVSLTFTYRKGYSKNWEEQAFHMHCLRPCLGGKFGFIWAVHTWKMEAKEDFIFSISIFIWQFCTQNCVHSSGKML
jgi:hypothetical protein